MTAVTPTISRPTTPPKPIAKPSPWTYTRFELLRSFRNRRFMIFSLAFPLLMFLLIALPNRHQQLGGINFATYYMVGMLSWGSMAAVIGCGARIAAERQINWHRQLRITPLPMRTYFATKLLSGYCVAALSIGVLYTAGTLAGVRLSALHWLELTGYVLVALLPFAIIGIVLGHLLKVDSMGPAIGGITSLFAILGGAWGPLASGGLMQTIVKLLPSYWVVQAGHTVVGGNAWPAQAWIVIAVWTFAAARIGMWVYHRDTERI